MTAKVGRSDWALVAAKHTFKQFNSLVNSIVLFDGNPYNTLNNDESRDVSLQNNLREVNKVTEVQAPSSLKPDHEDLMIKEINAMVKHHHKLDAMSIGRAKGNQLGDKCKHIIQSLPHSVSQQGAKN